jgi:pimeloyl-ACP methyl ester carboxylesterase
MTIDTTSGTVQFDAGRIAYEIAGNGEPLVLVHAGFVDRRMWDGQWRDFGRHYRVIRYDMRGYGASDPVQAPIARRDELGQLLAHLGVARAILLGCSLGGELVLDFALERPEQVAALVLESAVPSGFELQGAPPPDLLEMLAALDQGELEHAAELQGRLWIDGPFRVPGQVDSRIREYALEMARIAIANRTMLQVDAAPAKPLDPPAAQRLPMVQAPTLVIAGALDHPEVLRAADVLVHGIPQARKAVLADCAHLPNMERPDEFSQEVLAFLKQCR